MSQAEDLLNSLSEDEVAAYASLNPETEPHIVINPDRTVTVPESLLHIAVERDHNIETVTFDCPRYWDGHDLSQMKLRIVFQRPDGHREPHLAENVRVDSDDTNMIHFDWTISSNVTLVRGNISFTVCAKLTNAEGVSEREWHTRLNQDLIVDEGMDCSGEEIVEQNPDIIEAILVQLEELQNTGGTGSNSGQNVNQMEPMEDDIPRVFISGVKPTNKDDVLAEMQYISKTERFHAYLTIKCQGTSSMSYPKKNFTVKLYSDEARETKLKKDFKDWNHPGNKFVLKANWIDHSHARNIVSARLWGEVVASRPDYDSLPVELRNAPNNGAVDGFPVKVYYNGDYEGIYTWNIGKDDWMWGMDEDNPNHILLCAEGNTDGVFKETPSNFRTLWDGVDGQKPGWSVEVGTNSTSLKNSLNALIQFVMDNNGEAFRSGIGNYLDIQSAIDYYILQYEICGLDGLAHNMLLATYDGVKWHCGAYDLDATFGLWWNGTSFVPTTYRCPEDYQEQFSLLWERIEANFLPELTARQAELRKTVLSYPNMVSHFERFMDTIGLDLYAEDLTIYTGIPSGSTNNIKQIRNFIRDRQAYVDAEFATMKPPVPCTGISLDKENLTFAAEGQQTLHAVVTPSGCTDVVRWESNNTDVAVVVGGVVTAVANGSAVITVTCGDYSASCSVMISGLPEPVRCTGVTLDVSELNFDGEETKKITATVTPEDCTEMVLWEIDNHNVATVANGVVSSIANGSAVVTARCGAYSANCSVSVSGVGDVELLSNYVSDGTTKDVFYGKIEGNTRIVFDVDTSNFNHNAEGTWENIISVCKASDWGFATPNALSINWCEKDQTVRTRMFGTTPETETISVDNHAVHIEIDANGVSVNGVTLSSSNITNLVTSNIYIKIFGADKENVAYEIAYKGSHFTYRRVKQTAS